MFIPNCGEICERLAGTDGSLDEEICEQFKIDRDMLKFIMFIHHYEFDAELSLWVPNIAFWNRSVMRRRPIQWLTVKESSVSRSTEDQPEASETASDTTGRRGCLTDAEIEEIVNRLAWTSGIEEGEEVRRKFGVGFDELRQIMNSHGYAYDTERELWASTRDLWLTQDIWLRRKEGE